MTLSELIRKSIDTAVAGTDPDSNILQKLTLEAESLVDQALDQLARDVAGNPQTRALLETKFSVTLTNGEGIIDESILVEYIREGSVRDNSGNVLQKVKYHSDFLAYLPTIYGYYYLTDGAKILTRTITTGSFTTTQSPLTIFAPFVPIKSDMSTTVPVELQDNLVKLLAVKIRGIIDGTPHSNANTV